MPAGRSAGITVIPAPEAARARFVDYRGRTGFANRR